MTWRKTVMFLAWLVTLIPCLAIFVLGIATYKLGRWLTYAGNRITDVAYDIQTWYQGVHIWANPGKYPLGKL